MRAKIRENKEFCMRLLAFLKHIIKCSAKDDVLSDVLYHAYFNAREANTIEDFTAQLKENRKAVTKKV